jgi:ribosomal protein S21
MENSQVTPKIEPRVEPLKFSGMRIEVRPSDTRDGQMIQLEKALKMFKRKLEKDDVLRTIKERRYFTKPSALKRAEAKRLKHRKV